MPFIGNQPAEAFSSFQKQDFSTSATTSYTLDHPVSNQNEIALFINFVRQEPTAAYTASGTTLTLTSATSSSDDMYCVYLGKAVQTVNPPNSSVGSSQVSADLITGQTALGATPADTDELLISDAGTLKRVDYSYLKSSMTPAFYATNGSTDQSINDGTQTKVDFGTEILDSDSAFASSRFTVPSGKAGKYYLFASVDLLESDSDMESHNIYFFKNGSASVSHVFNNTSASKIRRISTYFGTIFDLSASDYMEIYFQFVGTAGNAASIKANNAATFFGGYKIIE